MNLHNLTSRSLFIVFLLMLLTTCKDNEPEPIEPPKIDTYEQSCCKIPPLQACIGGAKFYVPNAFSPNGDGINDIFYVHLGKGMQKVNSFKVFSVNDGSSIFESFDFTANTSLAVGGWDGTLPDNSILQEVYTYEVKATNIRGESMTYEGSVCLRLDTNSGTQSCVDNEGNCTYNIQSNGNGEFCVGCPSNENCN